MRERKFKSRHQPVSSILLRRAVAEVAERIIANDGSDSINAFADGLNSYRDATPIME